MSAREEAALAGLRGTLEAITEWAFEKGPGLTEAGFQLVLPHIDAAYQRGVAEGLREAANGLACLGPEDSLVSAPKAWNEAVTTLRLMADEHGKDSPQAESTRADLGEFIDCAHPHCPHGAWSAKAEERGWSHHPMDTWLCPEHQPTTDDTTNHRGNQA
jgi:hypothetical protein